MSKERRDKDNTCISCRSNNTNIPHCGLSLRELETCSCPFFPVFLSLFCPRISCNKPLFLECCPEVCVEFQKGLCDTMTQSPCLGRNSAAIDAGINIELADSTGKHEGFIDHELQFFYRKIIFYLPAVYEKFPCPLFYPDPCYRSLSFSCRVVPFFRQPVPPLASSPLASVPCEDVHCLYILSVF